MTKRALITGIFGQDGSYLAEILQEKGYEVHGVARMPLSRNAERIQRFLKSKGISPAIHECRLDRFSEVANLLERLKPDECYHLAATQYSSSTSSSTRDTVARQLYQNNVLTGSNLIYSMKEHSPQTRLVLAGSCLMFDATRETHQDEKTPYASKSDYGLSKIAVASLAKAFRESLGLPISTAILYNHESPRRDGSFVTQKIAHTVVLIKERRQEKLTLANLDSQKDWGYAKDYAYGMWLMSQQETPDDYILATGTGHTVQEFVKEAFHAVGILEWEKYVDLDQSIASVCEAILIGNPEKACRQLGWRHSKTFPELVKWMVTSAMEGSS